MEVELANEIIRDNAHVKSILVNQNELSYLGWMNPGMELSYPLARYK